MDDVVVEFVGGPLDGTIRSVSAAPDGHPPARFTVDAGAAGAPGRHDYRMAADRRGDRPWRYEYRGIRPG